MTDPSVTLYWLIPRRLLSVFYIEGGMVTGDWPVCHGLLAGKTVFSLNRMKILKKSLPSEKLSTTLARLDRQNMFEEIR
ncbi:hypothetical protein PSH79_08975 [Pseudomonas sp. FP2196]|uniref:hypothetical protein n=1 Tax=Pseudomonas sp. FP2196 TaxID=2954086 RepID=UPI002736CD10|nr:hypothetical protein [Pseudomonas sp. FP2196]WLH37420.1 hypothetical protein PSH79_08975 [Pseudomonas sp. FP2196]